VLLLSSVAGRQLFMDGMTNVVQVLHNPLIIAVLLVASYEVVALSNLFLAIGTFAFASEFNKKRRYLLVAILLLALPFQLFRFFSEPIAPARNGRRE
jgi:hypothetical protein